MSLKLTKTELRGEQTRLGQFRHYLPTLQLKKAMLQFEVMAADMEISLLQVELTSIRKEVETLAPFLSEKVSVNLQENADVLHVKKNMRT